MGLFDDCDNIPWTSEAGTYEERDDILAAVFALPQLQRTGMWLEFGVCSGVSLRKIAANKGNAKVYGFDSFKGLPEYWRTESPAGTFALNEPPEVDDAELVIGLFQDTLPKFVWHSPVTFVHIDCDVYSSTKCVLDALRSRLAPSAIIVFDELFTYPGHENHELKALKEAHADGFSFRWLFRGGERAAIVVDC